jgi:hypothetical protein
MEVESVYCEIKTVFSKIICLLVNQDSEKYFLFL